MTVTGEPETVETVVIGQYDVEVEYAKVSTSVVTGASVVYDWTLVGTSVTIKLVLVYVKVTTFPETVLVSVMGQMEVEVL